jgi:hypothetical protein
VPANCGAAPVNGAGGSFGKSRLRRFCGCAPRFRPAKGVTFAGLRPYWLISSM